MSLVFVFVVTGGRTVSAAGIIVGLDDVFGHRAARLPSTGRTHGAEHSQNFLCSPLQPFLLLVFVFVLVFVSLLSVHKIAFIFSVLLICLNPFSYPDYFCICVTV